MSLHHLDPRDVGIGRTPELEVYQHPSDSRWRFKRARSYGSDQAPRFDTEQAALRAARVAAGLGHVTEQPCATFQQTPACPECRRNPVHLIEVQHDCDTCAWPRTRHHAPSGAAMTAVTDRPLAIAGLTSYRYRGSFGFIMIGARNDAEALREANRSLALAKWQPATLDRLEVWTGDAYEPVRP